MQFKKKRNREKRYRIEKRSIPTIVVKENGKIKTKAKPVFAVISKQTGRVIFQCGTRIEVVREISDRGMSYVNQETV